MAGGHGGKFNPVDVTAPHVAYTVLGGFTVIFGMLSLFIRERMYIGEALIAFLFGVVVGPQGANIFNPRDWTHGNEHHVNEITLELTRIVLAIGVFAIGVELPKAYMARHWKSLFYLLGPVMTYGWFVSAGIIYALIPALTFKSSLAIAAALTPTDPILAAAVVGGGWADKHVPAHLRHLLAAESGCNDGAAFPFLFIAIYLTTYDNVGHAIRDWFLITWLYEIVLSCILGAIIGFLFRHLMKFCERKELIDRQSYVAQYVSLAMFANGVTTLIGSDDLLAAFAAGAAFAWDGFFNRQTEAAVFSSVIDLLFNVATFIYLGAWMPFESFTNVQLTLAPWRLLVIGLLVLLLRRLPIILALYRWIPDIKTFREAVFAGHFGPMGVGAIFIATLAAKKLPDVPETGPENQAQILAATIQPVVAFMVICSIAVHGLSIPFFSLGRRVHSVRRTWSRQRSKEATPEWAHGMRHADAPEDVVVNRDGTKEVATTSASGSENEKTEAPVAPAVDDAERERLARAIPDMLDDDGGSDDEVDSANPTRSPSRLVHPASADAARFIDSHAGTPTSPQGEHRPYEIPKDRVLVAEWREGPHLVVEHKAQDDDTGEVEVEVVHDAFASNEHLRLQSEIRKFAGTPDRVKNEVQEHIEKLGQRAGEKFEELMRSGSLRSSVGGSSDQGHAKAKDTDQEKKEAEAEDGNAPTPPKARGVATPGDGDESSGPESSGSADIAVPPTARRRGSGSGHRPHVSLTIQAPSQLASPTLATSPNTDTEALSPDDTPSRGRATAVPARLRPREVSPGRSIRFAVGDDTAHDRDAPTPGSPRTANHSRGDSVTRAGRSGSGLGMPRTSSYNGGSGMGLPRTSSVTNGSGLGMSRTSSIQGGSGVGLPSRTQTQSINGGAGGGSGLGMPRTDSKR